jgi:Domain of unknown function (DUF4349)
MDKEEVMDRKQSLACLAVLGVFLLAACSSAGPRQIASYPATPPVAREPYRPAEVLPYDADLVFAVADVDLAADQATQLAYEYGGYSASTQSWYQDGNRHIVLELSVPAARYDSLRSRLLDLGTLLSERVLNEVVSPGETSGRMTQVSVQLQPSSLTSWFDIGWNPVRTFMNAYGVVASIFRVVADIVIWVVVVIGPFALIALVIRIIVRRARRPV